MEWMEVKVLTTTEAADLISELLLEAGSEGTVIEDRNDVFANQRPEGQWDIIDPAIAERIGADVKVAGYFPADEHLADTLAALRERLRRLPETAAGLPLGKLALVTSGFEDEDWSQSWKRAFKPVRLGEHFVVRPGWTECPLEAGDREIVIDPGLAFGTGTHETTGMCATLVEKYVRPGMKVIEIGTGSGILAIAAAQMGAARVLATDLDPVAVRVAAENARANGCGGAVETRCGDLLEVVDECGDVVIANIIADAILQLAAPVRARIADGGMFIASGIAVDRRDEVEAALTGAEYEILDAPVKGEWAAFAARKR